MKYFLTVKLFIWSFHCYINKFYWISSAWLICLQSGSIHLFFPHLTSLFFLSQCYYQNSHSMLFIKEIKKIVIKIIFRWYLNRYYLMILSRFYFKSSQFLDYDKYFQLFFCKNWVLNLKDGLPWLHHKICVPFLQFWPQFIAHKKSETQWHIGMSSISGSEGVLYLQSRDWGCSGGFARF